MQLQVSKVRLRAFARATVVATVLVAGTGTPVAAAQSPSLGARPLSELRTWGATTGSQLGTSTATSTQVVRRLRALEPVVRRSARRLRSASRTERTHELARTRVALAHALDPLARSLEGTSRDLFFLRYQGELERLAELARLDRTPTGRPLAVDGGRAVADVNREARADSDGDGAVDAIELDDDGDGVIDARDPSDQGWGIPDALQLREDLDDDADENGAVDAAASSLAGLTVLGRARGAAGAYCIGVDEPAPEVATIAATRNLLQVARSRGCRPPARVTAPARRARAPRGAPAMRDATALGRTLLVEVRASRATSLDIAVAQTVVSGTASSLRFRDRRSPARRVRVRAGRRVVRVPLRETLAAGAATATVTVRSGAARGRRVSVPVAVPGSATAMPATTPAAPVAGLGVPTAALGAPAPATAVRPDGAPVRLVSATPLDANRIELRFDGPVGPSADDPASYATSPDLFVTGAARLPGLDRVVLSTGRQFAVSYRVTAAGVRSASGAPLVGTSATFTGSVPVAGDRPRVTAVGATGNRTVLVQFSTPLSDGALDPALYGIAREGVGAGGGLAVRSARFADDSRLAVVLGTDAQSQVEYRLRVTGITDLLGRPLADRPAGTNPSDPTTALFTGRAPGRDGDADCDGLTDAEESLGYRVTIVRANGREDVREVTSDPGDPDATCAANADAKDTDGDGLTDDVEKSLLTDPRDTDTDDDGLRDDIEYNESFSEPLKQDSDGDALTDGLETGFFTTSPILDDTDGDQITDDVEITLGNRNARVADLPVPGLEIGSSNLQLDVRFTDRTGTESKVVDSRRVTTSLQQTESEKVASMDRRAIETSTKVGTEAGFEITAAAKPSKTFSFKATAEQSFSSEFVSEWSEESVRETQDTYEKSTESQVEQAESADRTREVQGAAMQVAVTLRARGDIAFTLKNLQITALMQDPQDPSRLTPLATLTPASEPENGYALGPLVPRRGPIEFRADQVFPSLVEALMRNANGLVFSFSNYDVTDELGRNFAFTSQEVNDRTAGLVVDYGGFDADNDGVGDEVEDVRVATGTGRRIDTDGDGTIGDGDRRAAFSPEGKPLGVTLRDALAAMGLTEYREDDTPTASLSQTEIDNSYSIVDTADGQGEVLYRVRRTSVRPGLARSWEIVGPNGIDSFLTLDEQILDAGGSFTLAFIQDTDEDRVPAIVEILNRCLDSPQDDDNDGIANTLDTDKDGLDDRFEVYGGWDVTVERGSRRVRSSCSRPDTDLDGRTDLFEAPGDITRDDGGRIELTTGREPQRDITGEKDPLLGWALTDPITDPTSKDTDADGLSDDFELIPYSRELLSPPADPGEVSPTLPSSPEHFDSDMDGASDGVEWRIGGDKRKDDADNFNDSDGDGLVNAEEKFMSYEVRVRGLATGTCERVCAADGPEIVTAGHTSDWQNPDSDGDGLNDGDERERGLKAMGDGAQDTDGDGLSDFEEVRGYPLHDIGTITTDPLKRDSDRDKRSDGREAGRGSTGLIIVRVPGQDPYVGLSDPREPDVDLDRLVDGDEGTAGTDPRKANTDADSLDDFTEVRHPVGRRPLVPDRSVQIQFYGLRVERDGETGSNAGDFRFGFTGQRPDGTLTCVTNCGPDTGDFSGMEFQSSDQGADVIDLRGCDGPLDKGPCREGSNPGFVQIDSGNGFERSARNINIGSVSISPAQFETFALRGFFIEYEGPDDTDCRVRFPDPIKGTLEDPLPSGIFRGDKLEQGITPLIIKRTEGCDIPDDGSLEVEFKAALVVE